MSKYEFVTEIDVEEIAETLAGESEWEHGASLVRQLLRERDAYREGLALLHRDIGSYEGTEYYDVADGDALAILTEDSLKKDGGRA